MSECMGLLSGTYDAKTGGGFQAGGMSLHNIMAGHGPDADAHDRASNAKLEPQKIMTGSMAFMFGSSLLIEANLESSLMIGVSEWALKQAHVQEMYSEHSWGSLKRHFPTEQLKKMSNAAANGAVNGH
jgi:homogentisate 1,2-dioxygenase